MTWNKKHFPSFLKGFHLPKIVSDLGVCYERSIAADYHYWGKSIHRKRVLVVPMYGASLESAFNFCDTFWKISSICLLNFNLQLKVIRSSFSLRELFMCKAPISSVLCYWLFKSRWYRYLASFHYSKPSLESFLLFPLELLIAPAMLFLTSNGVPSSA